MSLISTLIITTIIYYNRLYLENIVEEAFKASELTLNMDVRDLYTTFLQLRKNLVSSIFSYLFIANIFLFLTLLPNTYEVWKISPYWLVPFMLIIVLNKVSGLVLNEFFSENVIAIVRYIYTWYGVKTLYLLSTKVGIKFNLLKHTLSIVLAIIYPLPVFVLGALASFDIVEVETIKI